MKFINYNLLEHENYIRENNLTQILCFNLFCYQIIFYNNPKYYFNCICYKRNHT